jgi:asparagine synthetase B (glutamine-hydrolysing)
MEHLNKDIVEFYNYKFDFDNQIKISYDDWFKAFENAIRKRAVNNCFVGLSSGYDSGAITKELSKQNVDFKVYTIFNNENQDVILKRLLYIPNCQISEMSKELWQGYYDFLNGKINETAMKDKASMGVAYMFDTARKQGKSVCLSGQGGDEIISDYALFPNQSEFKGVFPNKLYEWKNFRKGMQEEYLNELEEIAVLYGIEVRYPFLDVNLVQEFLWLSTELKNRNYKAPLYEYLIKNYVPFDKEVKRGFRPVTI